MSEPVPFVYLVIPVHNRKKITLHCLETLGSQGVFQWASVIVVDDGSTDGTAATISRLFPQVEILHGDGSLWWTGAIALGMARAMQRGADFVIWLNDDSPPEKGALQKLVKAAYRTGGLVSGVTRTETDFSYGGYRKTWKGLEPVAPESTAPNGLIPCDSTNGNCVCLPRDLIEKVGPPRFRRVPHYHGDTDYSLSVRRAGLDCYLHPEAVCESRHHMKEIFRSWLLSDRPIFKVWKDVFSVRSSLYWKACWAVYLRHWNPAVGFFLFSRPYAKLIVTTLFRLMFPLRLLRAWFGSYSESWRWETQADAAPDAPQQALLSFMNE